MHIIERFSKFQSWGKSENFVQTFAWSSPQESHSQISELQSNSTCHLWAWIISRWRICFLKKWHFVLLRVSRNIMFLNIMHIIFKWFSKLFQIICRNCEFYFPKSETYCPSKWFATGKHWRFSIKYKNSKENRFRNWVVITYSSTPFQSTFSNSISIY